MSIKFCSSVIMVKDLAASRNFYEELLKQQVELDHGPCVGFKGGLSIWQIEHAQSIIFKDNKLRNNSQEENHTFELYFETDELEGIYKKITDTGMKLVHDTFEQPWGQRVFRVFDPDMNIVEIAEPMTVVIKRLLVQGMNGEEVASKTAMPLEIVLQVQKDM